MDYLLKAESSPQDVLQELQETLDWLEEHTDASGECRGRPSDMILAIKEVISKAKF